MVKTSTQRVLCFLLCYVCSTSVMAQTISFVGTRLVVTETATTVDIAARLQGGNASPTTVDVVVQPVSTATGNEDYTLPASLQLQWEPLSDGVDKKITLTVNNDALPENTEYIIVQLANPSNATVPTAATNHFTVFIKDNDKKAPVPSQAITLNHIASFSNGAAGTNSAEIVAHDPGSKRLFIANSIGAKLDVVDFANPSAATLVTSVSMTPYGNINSVAVRNGTVAVAVENTSPQQPGKVVFFDVNGTYQNQVDVGAMPDMITFNQAGTKVLTANEGEPDATYTADPEGSISIIDISGGVNGLTQANVITAGFAAFNGQAAALRAAGIRLFGANNPTVAQDLEPEYITISADDQTAWVTCQENNAIAVIDLTTGAVTDIRPLGTKDHSLARNAFDASDNGTDILLANWPVKGVYMPDAIASYTIGGQTYLVTANEGDAREYGTAYVEPVRLNASSYVLDPTVFPNAAALKANTNLGRVNVTTASGDLDGDGDYDEIHVFGARSFSIWNATTGALVWDSGDELEQITANHPQFSTLFNASNSNNTVKNRSDDKGPEPEGVTVVEINGKVYAFVALERIGGCMVYDITDPNNPTYVDYKNTRNLAAYGGDNGAEGILYISAANSPTNTPLVVLANEVSSTLTFFSINNSTLPITLRDVKATNIANRNLVEWSTADESKGDEAEVQRSKDGRHFATLATVAAKGAPSLYQFWDEQPWEGINFYRLKLKHATGGFSFSAVVSATLKETGATLSVYPNPAKNTIILKSMTLPTPDAIAEMVDASGRVALRIKVNQPVQVVDVSNLPAGIYTLRYWDKKETKTVLISKQ
jgi:hypothetical protein